MSPAMSPTDVRSEPGDGPPPGRHPGRRTRWVRLAAIAVAAAVAVVLVVWTNWMAQRYLFLDDDSARGARFREALDPTGTERERFVVHQCFIAAEAFYGHDLKVAGEDSGPAPPNEKAFYHACSGAVLGGHGGGGGMTLGD